MSDAPTATIVAAIQARIDYHHAQIATMQQGVADLTREVSAAANPQPVFESLHRLYDRIAVEDELIAELTALVAEEAQEEAGEAQAQSAQIAA